LKRDPELDLEIPGRLVTRIRSLISTAALDCDCRQKVGDALQRFVDQEQQRIDRRHLLEARQHRAAITALLGLLADLEDVSWSEVDRSVFHELAHLFDDVAEQARYGAEALRGIGRA
jgi:hypothetical protein